MVKSFNEENNFKILFENFQKQLLFREIYAANIFIKKLKYIAFSIALFLIAIFFKFQ